MNLKHTTAFAMMSMLVAVASGCIVEAGNPHPDEDGKDKSAMVSVSIATSSSQLAQKFSVALKQISLVGKIKDETVSQDLAPAQASVDLISSSDGEVVALANATKIKRADYSQLILKLADENPIQFVDTKGKPQDVSFENEKAKSLLIYDQFDLSESETGDVLITLDLDRSIVPRGPGQEGVLFRPRASFFGRRRSIDFEGTVEQDNATYACAYIYAPDMPPPPLWDPAHRPPRDPSQPPRFEAIPRPIFTSKSDLVKDETSECKNAYARAAVSDGKYVFHHLRPGMLDVRLFLEDGSFVDIETEKGLMPPPPRLRRGGEGPPPPIE